VWSPDEDLAALTERLQAYVVKAAREAKRSTSWISPNAEYEKALCDFVGELLADPERSAFIKDFRVLAATVAFFGRINSLAQTVLKITAPGIPDFYQGTELTALTLVDPDNRHRVAFDVAAAHLDVIERLQGSPRGLLWEQEGAASKLYVIQKLLQLRHDDPELFARGDYQALQVDGARKEHVFAFARTYGGRSCIVIVPRWTAKLMDAVNELPLGEQVWADTRVNASAMQLRDVLTESDVVIDGAIAVASALVEFPVAVLVGSQATA
jgi:(1->4)-alpha-D-glucan 1-alpha-D-glucosylmutase